MSLINTVIELRKNPTPDKKKTRIGINKINQSTCKETPAPSINNKGNNSIIPTSNGKIPDMAAAIGNNSVLNTIFLTSDLPLTTELADAKCASEIASQGAYPLISQIT